MEDGEKVREAKIVQKETKFEATEKISETSEIDKLPDDCLIEIFQHLTTIADKIRIERVCKRWQKLSRKSWNNFKSLDFAAKTWGLEENGSDDQLSIRSIDFDKLIRLSGRYLTRIYMDVKKFSKICNLLPNIRELQLYQDYRDLRRGVDTSNPVILSWLLSHGKNITLVHLKSPNSYLKEKDFVRVLGKMKQLKSLYLHDIFNNWSGISLLELPFEVIQEIFLIKVIKDSDQNILPTMLKKCKKLQTFGLVNCKGDGILEALSSQADTLKNLKLKIFFPEDQYVFMSKMSALIHLEKLDVEYCHFVSDAFLEVVSKHCKKLTYLNLGGCKKITDAGISCICNLEELTYLNIGGLPKRRNPPLEKLTNLVVLDLHGSEDIQEEWLCSFLRNAPQLRALSLNGDRFVPSELLNAAEEAAKMRNHSAKLDLYINGILVSLDVASRKWAFLNILRMHHLPVAKYGVENPFCDRYVAEVGVNDSKLFEDCLLL